jgi:hypothetical protein
MGRAIRLSVFRKVSALVLSEKLLDWDAFEKRLAVFKRLVEFFQELDELSCSVEIDEISVLYSVGTRQYKCFMWFGWINAPSQFAELGFLKPRCRLSATIDIILTQ